MSDWDAPEKLSPVREDNVGGLTVPQHREPRASLEPVSSRHGLEALAAEKRAQQEPPDAPVFRPGRSKSGKKRPRSPRPPSNSLPHRHAPNSRDVSSRMSLTGAKRDVVATKQRPDLSPDAQGESWRPKAQIRCADRRFSKEMSGNGSAVGSLAKPVAGGVDPVALRQYEAEQERAEREWYLGDDASATIADATFYMDEKSEASAAGRRMSIVASAKQSDTTRWEAGQLRAGLYHNKGDHDGGPGFDDDNIGPRVTLLVKESIPSFLSNADHLVPSTRVASRAVVGSDIVMPVKDPTSDMAIIARKGSSMVSEYREKRGRASGRTKYWELGTSVGAKAKEDAEKEAEQTMAATSRYGGNANDWRKDVQYAKSMPKAPENSARVPEPSKDAAIPDSGKQVSRTIAEIRRSLPVFAVREELLDIIRENQVIIVEGETGSGKTTQLTQYLHEEGYTNYGIVGCTQPRRVAAVSVAQRVADEFNGGGLGAEVGYAIRFEDCTGPGTCIKYMTDGILLRESLGDPDLEKYSVIIMDEAHERSLNTDVLFGALRIITSRRRDLKVIITSATLNAERFSSFFGHAPVFRIPGRTFPVDTFYSKTPVEDYVDGAVWQVVQIHLQAPLPGDILVFMTGQEDIETCCEGLADKLGKLECTQPVSILPIYSQLAADLQAKIFEAAPADTRKVIVATNIAETSLTIDGIRYVVDAGYCKLKTYNPRLGMDALLLCPASQAAVNQRAGRAGRTGPGKCYRLFTGSAYSSEMLDNNVPEIQRTNLSHVVLLLKSLGVKDVLDFPFLDPPPAEIVLKSMLALWFLGALDNNGDLTDLGDRMSKLPVDPALSALLFCGEKLECLDEAATIVAMLSVPNVFMRPQGREEESDSAREKFFVSESDHLTLLHTYQRWLSAGGRAEWCAKHFISGKGMRKAREVREQLVDMLKAEGVTMSTGGDDWDVIRRAVCSAFYFQAARRKGMSEYISLRSGVVAGLHPTSSIYNAGMTPDYVVYHELVYTKREYMSVCTAAEPEWLASGELGTLLYYTKHSNN